MKANTIVRETLDARDSGRSAYDIGWRDACHAVLRRLESKDGLGPVLMSGLNRFLIFGLVAIPSWLLFLNLFMLPLWIPLVGFGLLCALSLWPRLQTPCLRGIALLYAAITLPVTVLYMHCPFYPSSVRWIALAVVLFGLVSRVVLMPQPRSILLLVAALTFYNGYSLLSFKGLNDPDAVARVNAEPGLHVVPAFTDSGIDFATHGDVRFAVRNPARPNLILVGILGNESQSFWYDETTQARIPIATRGVGDNALVLPELDTWVLPDYRGDQVLIGSLMQPGVFRAVGCGHEPRVVQWDEKRQRILMLDETTSIWAIPLNGSPTKLLDTPRYTTWITWNPATDEIIASWSRAVMLIDSTTLRTRASIPVTSNMQGTHDLDVEGQRVFHMANEKGELEVIDLRTARVTHRVHLGFGYYHLSYDPYRHVLLVGNYAHGDMLVLDPTDFSVLSDRFVGYRARFISFDSAAALVTTGAGVVEIQS